MVSDVLERSGYCVPKFTLGTCVLQANSSEKAHKTAFLTVKLTFNGHLAGRKHRLHAF